MVHALAAVSKEICLPSLSNLLSQPILNYRCIAQNAVVTLDGLEEGVIRGQDVGLLHIRSIKPAVWLYCRESIVLSNLDGCNVYLLDYSGGVEVTNVKNSQIFIGMHLVGVSTVNLGLQMNPCSMHGCNPDAARSIAGPVDGFAIFNNVEGCQIAVACQQLQVKNSSDTEIGLYCATKPTIESCSDIRFTCWMGAYPGLTQHFSKANLDPKANHWDKVGKVASATDVMIGASRSVYLLHLSWRVGGDM